MQLIILNTQIYLLLFSVALITSCGGKDKPTISENTTNESGVTLKTNP